MVVNTLNGSFCTLLQLCYLSLLLLNFTTATFREMVLYKGKKHILGYQFCFIYTFSILLLIIHIFNKVESLVVKRTTKNLLPELERKIIPFYLINTILSYFFIKQPISTKYFHITSKSSIIICIHFILKNTISFTCP